MEECGSVGLIPCQISHQLYISSRFPRLTTPSSISLLSLLGKSFCPAPQKRYPPSFSYRFGWILANFLLSEWNRGFETVFLEVNFNFNSSKNRFFAIIIRVIVFMEKVSESKIFENFSTRLISRRKNNFFERTICENFIRKSTNLESIEFDQLQFFYSRFKFKFFCPVAISFSLVSIFSFSLCKVSLGPG